jgi:hypothetical protein
VTIRFLRALQDEFGEKIQIPSNLLAPPRTLRKHVLKLQILPPDSLVLPKITRKTVIQVAKSRLIHHLNPDISSILLLSTTYWCAKWNSDE